MTDQLENLSVTELEALIESAQIIRRQKQQKRVLRFTVDGQEHVFDTVRQRLWVGEEGGTLSPFSNVVSGAFQSLMMTKEMCDTVGDIFKAIGRRL